MILPPELSFAQLALDTMAPRSGREEKLKEEVLALLSSASNPPLDENSAASVQARILMEAGLYVDTMHTLLREQLDLAGIRL